MKKYPLVSIIVPVYNVEEYIRKCIDSILAQTYNNIELIIVNDASPGPIAEIMTEYEGLGNIVYVDLQKNVGLFGARMAGYAKATGKYLAFIDGDDNVSVDYIRLLVAQAEADASDIVMGETVIEESSGRKYIYSLANDLLFDQLEGPLVFGEFMRQHGDNFMWHVVHSKLFRKSVFDTVADFYRGIGDHIIMCEDVLYSIPLWSKATRVSRSRTAYYYYYSRDDSSTKQNSLGNFRRSIGDITKVFKYTEKYLKTEGMFDSCREDFEYWVNAYAKMWKNRVDWHVESRDEKQLLFDDIRKFSKRKNLDFSNIYDSEFYKAQSDFNPALDNDLKMRIIDPEISVVSFDIFDTLVLRPVYEPVDVFRFMNKHFRGLRKEFRLLEFSQMRVQAEKEARAKFSEQEDITIDQIYQVFKSTFRVSKAIAEEMKQLELEYELKFCYQRKTAKELFDLARYLGKRVIVATDMYLPRKIIKEILSRNGYRGYDKLYISSEIKLAKATGNLFDYIAGDLGVESSEIVHIGDNYFSDYRNALKAGWGATMLPKPTDAMNSDSDYFGAPILNSTLGVDNLSYAMQNIGTATIAAIAANKMFDNPFTPFNRDSDFSCTPSFIGHYALGMQMFGLASWLLRDVREKGIERVVFLARDGYLPKVIVDKVIDTLKLDIQTSYFYSSRKAMIPLALALTGAVIDLRSFRVLKDGNEKSVAPLRDFIKHGHSLEAGELQSLDSETAELIEGLLDQDKLSNYMEAYRQTYEPVFSGQKTALFDIGYSGKPSELSEEIFGTSIHTYFMYANDDEARERLGERVSVFGRFQKMGLREMIISEPSASCVGYDLDPEAGRVTPRFDENFSLAYYERTAISTMQERAGLMIDDLSRFFSHQMDELYWGDYNLVSMPINKLFDNPTLADALLFRGLMHEDEIDMGTVDVADAFYQDEAVAVDVVEKSIKSIDIDTLSRAKRVMYYVLYDREELRTLPQKMRTVPRRIIRKMRNRLSES